MSVTGRYLYGVIPAPEAETVEFGEIGLPHEGKPGRVYTVRVDSLAAVVSDYAVSGKILPLRKNLEPHNKVIREVMKTVTVIPMTFGHVARSEKDIVRLLRRNRTEIRAQLERVQGSVEMGLKIKWGVDNIFEHIASLDPELAAMRDRLFGGGAEPTQPEKIELGRMFEDRLNKEREAQTERVLELFQASVVESKVNPPRNEQTVMDVAFLVKREDLQKFEARVYEVANTFPAHYVFDFNGPWAPFNFIDLDLQQVAA
ncbi:GvpL/GvpF family gas vesicle protein [Hyalangium gracile]|uniref:GvpL/GvpF family gas vesicle protein n=1 Tax=Hyalangium gracile TaxID=394092 RepID=UPI001CC90AFC|nr:GvpL/GvpF family gas vesicle protein [Hyalangium gracile]